MDVRAYNREAWNRQVADGNPWTIPVSTETVAAARRGEWTILLTPSIPVPRAWFPPLAGADVLCLASGGGQQGPILAAAGAQRDRLRQLAAPACRRTDWWPSGRGWRSAPSKATWPISRSSPTPAST